MAVPSASYSITMRTYLSPGPRAIGQVTSALSEAGGSVVAVDMVESQPDLMITGITVNAMDGQHADALTAAVDALEAVRVQKVSDRTFLMTPGRQAGGDPDRPHSDSRRPVDGLHPRRRPRLPGHT